MGEGERWSREGWKPMSELPTATANGTELEAEIRRIGQEVGR
jgi:hypothetical protein